MSRILELSLTDLSGVRETSRGGDLEKKTKSLVSVHVKCILTSRWRCQAGPWVYTSEAQEKA